MCGPSSADRDFTSLSQDWRWCDFVFSALPHQASMDMVAALAAKGVKIIDLSADFRFRDVSLYEAWYHNHSAPELSQNAVYGLPEFYRAEIKDAALVANPGCYTTCSILALAPFLKEGLLESESIVIDAKSGTSGAGSAEGFVAAAELKVGEGLPESH